MGDALALILPPSIALGAGPDEAAVRDGVRPFLDAHRVERHGPANE